MYFYISLYGVGASQMKYRNILDVCLQEEHIVRIQNTETANSFVVVVVVGLKKPNKPKPLKQFHEI